MQTGKYTALIACGLLLSIAALVIGGSDDREAALSGNTSGKLSRLLSPASDSLEQRVARLEDSLKESIQIQSQLFELVEDLRAQGEPGSPPVAVRQDSVSAESQLHRAPANQSREQRYQQHRDQQLQRMVDAGISPQTAEYILTKQERFQYEQMQYAYQYRHIKDKSSAEANALREKLHMYSNPRNLFEQELTPEEFELYLQTNGGSRELQVNDVLVDTPAAAAGLQPGDTIVSYNGKRIFHMGDLHSQVHEVPPGKTVALEIQRAGSSSKETLYVPSGPLGIRW